MAFVRAAEKVHAQRGSRRRSTNAHRHDCKYARISSYTPPRNFRPTIPEHTPDEDRNKFHCTTNAITSKSVDPIETLPSDRTTARDKIQTFGKGKRNGSLPISSMSAQSTIRLLRDLSLLPSCTRWRISYPRTPAPPFWHYLLERYLTTYTRHAPWNSSHSPDAHALGRDGFLWITLPIVHPKLCRGLGNTWKDGPPSTRGVALVNHGKNSTQNVCLAGLSSCCVVVPSL